MSALDRVKVFQDDVSAWWLEFYADNIRHQVTIEDVLNGLASFVNMQATNAVLHEKVNDAAEELAAMRDVIEAARGLVEYRDRVGPLNFQLEKADDWLRIIRNKLEER